jgi:hypothetical protein
VKVKQAAHVAELSVHVKEWQAVLAVNTNNNRLDALDMYIYADGWPC